MTLENVMDVSNECRERLDKLSIEISAHENYCSLAGDKSLKILYGQLQNLKTDLENMSWMMSATRVDIMSNNHNKR